MYYIKAQVNNSIYTAVADTDLFDLRTDARIMTTHHSIRLKRDSYDWWCAQVGEGLGEGVFLEERPFGPAFLFPWGVPCP